MTTLHRSEKTHQGMLPQFPALESVSADNPGEGTKRGTEADPQGLAAGVQHGRGETPNTSSARHPSAGGPVQGDLCVFVLDRRGLPLQPTSPRRAKELLRTDRARVARRAPFTIRLVDRVVEDSVVDGVELGVDPGSKTTGISVHQVAGGGRVGLFGVEIQHRGDAVQKKLQQRSAYRRGRRSRNLRYRKPRFDNRTKPAGWLAPSLRHRVDTTLAWVERFQRWAPVTRIDIERVSFDTQLMQNPDIAGVEYQRGTLFGTEVRQYVLTKWNYSCVYCGAKDVPLNLDHVVPKGRNGSDRVSNLVPACVPCNQAKDVLPVEVFLKDRLKLLKRIRSQVKTPLRDAAAVQSTRNSLFREVGQLGVSVGGWSGGRTKWNRTRNNLPKTHTNDALCVGDFSDVLQVPGQVLVVEAKGRGSYQRTRVTKDGFPRGYLTRSKRVHGFATGDLVKAVVPNGKNAGTHVGRVAVRQTGSFAIQKRGTKVDGISWKNVRLLQRSDGYSYGTTAPRPFLPMPEGRGFLGGLR